jgi:membrane protease YdiL (CAAX protease family)
VPGDTQSPPLYLLDVVVSIVIVTLMGGIGEEIGWRGYMLPHLLKLGATPALLISGFAHGLFHLPAILGTSVYHGPRATP